MAQPEKNNVDYFPFLCKEGKAINYIENRYGNDGYSTWIKLLREIAVTDFHYLNLSDEIQFMFLSSKCRVDENMLDNIISDLCKLGEFDKELWQDYKIVWSEKFIYFIQEAYKRRTNKCLDKTLLCKHLNITCNHLQSNSKYLLSKSDKPRTVTPKENKTKENKTKEVEKKSFAPPIIDEVFQFFVSKSLETLWTESECNDQSLRFINFYESKNWMVGKNKMTKWKNAASGWISRDKEVRQGIKPFVNKGAIDQSKNVNLFK